jgi:hypothetical protein
MANGADVSLLSTATLPSTATLVVIVTAGALGADHIMSQLFAVSAFDNAIIAFAAILSFLTTFIAVKLPLIWRLCLWPVNFCVLIYLVISSSFYLDAINKRGQEQVPVSNSHIISQTILPPG